MTVSNPVQFSIIYAEGEVGLEVEGFRALIGKTLTVNKLCIRASPIDSAIHITPLPLLEESQTRPLDVDLVVLGIVYRNGSSL